MKKTILILFALISLSCAGQQVIIDTTTTNNKWLYTWDGTAQFTIVKDSTGQTSDALSYIEVILDKTRIVLGDTIAYREAYRIPLEGQAKAKAFIESTTMRTALKREVKKYGIKKKLTER